MDMEEGMKLHKWIMKEFGTPGARMPKTAAYSTFFSMAVFCIINPMVWLAAIAYLIYGDKMEDL